MDFVLFCIEIMAASMDCISGRNLWYAWWYCTRRVVPSRRLQGLIKKPFVIAVVFYLVKAKSRKREREKKKKEREKEESKIQQRLFSEASFSNHETAAVDADSRLSSVRPTMRMFWRRDQVSRWRRWPWDKDMLCLMQVLFEIFGWNYTGLGQGWGLV